MKLRLSDIFLPKEEIAGLELNDTGAHLILFSGDCKLVSKSGVIFPPGLIENGEVKDRLKLIKALEILKLQAGPKKLKENPYVIVSLPAQNVYSQILELPTLSPQQTEEAVKWNAQMTLPLEPSQMYYDWQEIKAPFREAVKKEVFVALAAKTKVDPYLDVFEEAGFIPLAVEMPALGLTRLVRFFATDVDRTQSYLLVAIDWSGAELAVVKNDILRFDYFRNWKPAEKEKMARGEMTAEDLANILALDVQKTVNFYQARSRENVAGMILMSSLGQKAEIGEFLKSKSGLDIFDFRLKYLSDLDDAWFPALGSALRGLTPREEDTIVSLMPVGTEEYYQKNKLLNFISLWGNVVGTVFLGLAGLFLITDVFLSRVETNLSRQLISQPANLKEAAELEAKAQEFNNLVAGVLNAHNASRISREWGRIFSGVFGAADGVGVTILRLSVASIDKPVTIQAEAISRENALAFKTRLEGIPFLYNVDLPPAGFVQGIRVSFSISFGIDLSKLIEE
jgi:hypothetical protein